VAKISDIWRACLKEGWKKLTLIEELLKQRRRIE